jgi:hypothetical protein
MAGHATQNAERIGLQCQDAAYEFNTVANNAKESRHGLRP